METFGENANEGRQTEGPRLRVKTSTNTAAAAQIGAVKLMMMTTDDSTVAKKQEVGIKLRNVIRGLSPFFPTTTVSLVKEHLEQAQRVASVRGRAPAVASLASC